MDQDKILNILEKRPAVHQLCSGVFIQESIWIKENLIAVPLKALGLGTQAQFTARYAKEIIGAEIAQESFDQLLEQGEQSYPTVVLALQNQVHAPIEALESNAEPHFNNARRMLSLISGNSIDPFAMVTALSDKTSFRLLPPNSKKRIRLGFGNTGEPFDKKVTNLINAAEEDEHFAFALSMYHDALHENNPRFKIARFFACLESLAYKIKSEEKPSRKAVKFLIGIEDGNSVNATIDGKEYKYDRIEIAGRIRDKLFHGIPFRKKDLIKEAQDAYELYEKHPEHIANSLKSDCEIEIARWANGASRGLKTN
ncbi:MAG: hypothetical protein U5K69_04585 [Balneolaceae bacterium]|nr:hypothetical protein [Balneolaceae bacterium]